MYFLADFSAADFESDKSIKNDQITRSCLCFEDSFTLREELSAQIHSVQPTEHEAAMLVLLRMYQETLDRVAERSLICGCQYFSMPRIQPLAVQCQPVPAAWIIEERAPQRMLNEVWYDLQIDALLRGELNEKQQFDRACQSLDDAKAIASLSGQELAKFRWKKPGLECQVKYWCDQLQMTLGWDAA